VGAVGFHRPHRQPELVADLPVGEPKCDQPQDLAFPIAQITFDTFELSHLHAEPAIDVRLSPGSPADRLYEGILALGPKNEPHGPVPKRVARSPWIGVGAEDDQAGLGRNIGQRLKKLGGDHGLGLVAGRDNQNVGPVTTRIANGFIGPVGNRHDLEPGLVVEQRPDTASYEFLPVGEDDGDDPLFTCFLMARASVVSRFVSRMFTLVPNTGKIGSVSNAG
jgi:hypothetical protein